MRMSLGRRALLGLATSGLVVLTAFGTVSCGSGESPGDTDADTEDGTAASAGGVVAVGVFSDEEQMVALAPGSGEVLWEAGEVEDSAFSLVLGFGSLAVVVDPSGDGLVGTDADTGEEAWSVQLDNADYVAPAGDHVLVYDGDEVTAFAASSGDQTWTYEAPDSSGVMVTADAQRVLVAGDDDLVLLDATDGSELWRVAEVWPRELDQYDLDYDGEDFAASSTQGIAGLGPRVPMAYVDETVVVAPVEDADLFAVDAETGEELWAADDSDRSGFGMLGWEDSVVSVGRDGLAAWNAASGDPVWELALDLGPGGDGPTSDSPDAEDYNEPDLVQLDNILVLADPEVGLVGVDLSDGQRLWGRTMDDLDDVTAADDLLVALVDGAPTALDPLTGEVTWTGEPGDDLVVLRDTADGVLVDVESGRGFDLGTGEELWTLEDE